MGNIAALAGAERVRERLIDAAEAAELQRQYDAPAYGETSASTQVSVPAAADTKILAQETYAQSTRLLKFAGNLLLKQTVETPETKAVMKRVKAEYLSSLAEMLNTDPEFHGQLEINSEHTYKAVGGRPVTADGVTFIEGLIANGAKASRAQADINPRMEIQAVRDEIDVFNMAKIQTLEPGEGWIFLAMDPKESFAIDKDFWKDVGGVNYREGLAYEQWFFRLSDDEFVFGTYSVDESDLEIWREVQAGHGVNIPEGETTSTWHAHGIKLKGTLEEMRAKAQQMRADFYAKRGITTKRYSVDDFLKINKDIVDEGFELFYKRLAKSQAEGVKDPVIHEFVAGILKQPPKNLPADVASDLNKILAKDTLGDDDVPLIEESIRYGVVERLRTGLAALVSGRKVEVRRFVPAGQSADTMAAIRAARALAGDLSSGVKAKRSYGGCAGGRLNGAGRRTGKKSEASQSASNDEGRENASEEDDEADSSSSELCCPKCRVSSPVEEIEQVNAKGETYWQCPCCGYFADCHGNTGYKKNQPEAPKPESVVAEVMSALGFTAAVLAADTAGAKA